MTREEAIAELKMFKGHTFNKTEEALDMAIKALEQEPKIGHWLMTGEVDVFYDLPFYECSKCGQTSLENGDYCPNCGARMEESEE